MMRLVGGGRGIGRGEESYIDVPYDDVRVFLEDTNVRCFHNKEKMAYTLAWYFTRDEYYTGEYLAWVATQMLLDAVRAGEPVFVFPGELEVIEYAESKGWGKPVDD